MQCADTSIPSYLSASHKPEADTQIQTSNKSLLSDVMSLYLVSDMISASTDNVLINNSMNLHNIIVFCSSLLRITIEGLETY